MTQVRRPCAADVAGRSLRLLRGCLHGPRRGALHVVAASACRANAGVAKVWGSEACLPASLVAVLSIAIQVVVVTEEISVCCIPEGQRLNDFGILQCVALVIFHLSSSTKQSASPE